MKCSTNFGQRAKIKGFHTKKPRTVIKPDTKIPLERKNRRTSWPDFIQCATTMGTAQNTPWYFTLAVVPAANPETKAQRSSSRGALVSNILATAYNTQV